MQSNGGQEAMSYDEWRERHLDTPIGELQTCCGEPVEDGAACERCGRGDIWLPGGD